MSYRRRHAKNPMLDSGVWDRLGIIFYLRERGMDAAADEEARKLEKIYGV